MHRRLNPTLLVLLHKMCCEVAASRPFGHRRSDPSESAPTVAALVPVHEPSFPVFESFVKQWNKCPAARRDVALFVVFSSSSSAHAFETRMQTIGVSSSSWNALVISTGDDTFLGHANPKSWKKLDALAQVLDVQIQKLPTLEFAIMMDSEIEMNSCEGFAEIPHALRAKFGARVWYADPGYSVFRRRNVAAASAIMVDCADPAQSARLLEQTNNLTVDTWWQDVPWVELKSARRMFSMWSDMLSTNRSYRSCDPDDHNNGLEQVATTSGPLTPLHVSARMGSLPLPLLYAGVAFEHIVYQYYMVVREGFRIEMLNVHTHCCCSFAEGFWRKEFTEQELYMSKVKPLWVRSYGPGGQKLPIGARSFAPPKGTAVLLFHTDRPW
eukprot:TRINITY_DN4426_c0_g1_i1.p1 TRINITY_DN4426_c0_g1~~TRINITY_DN4426_c0_g1_i1.p1  ORF type:complete len:383 (+),score=33.65 TRINITY_DN4426_c0_g1_i1:54-1202(+)